MTTENATFTFLVSWILWLVGLSLFNKTRLGHVVLYYSLAIMILFVVLTEYKQLVPFISGIVPPSGIGTSQQVPVPVGVEGNTAGASVPSTNGPIVVTPLDSSNGFINSSLVSF